MVFGIIISLGIERQGDEFDQRNYNIENIKGITEEVKSIKVYTEEYPEDDMYIYGTNLQNHRHPISLMLLDTI